MLSTLPEGYEEGSSKIARYRCPVGAYLPRQFQGFKGQGYVMQCNATGIARCLLLIC